jgi:serine/threonine protein kinase
LLLYFSPSDGYPIIVDFGFTKYLEPGEKTHTFCGTPNYIAPEVITSMGHGKEVDFWALGVVIYEMVSGDNPFFHDGMEQSEMYEAIVEQDPYEMRDGVTATDQVRELTDLLLLKDPQERLGALGFQEILDHPWFVGLPPISDILNKTLGADRLSELAFDEVQFVEESNNNGTIADGMEEPEDLLETESDVSVQLELPQDFRRPPKELSLNLDDSSLDGTILPLSQGHASARTVSVEGLIVKHDAARTQSVSAPSTPKQKLIDRWMPRTKGLGYYVTMLSPVDRENSRSRRGVVDSFLARYLDGVDVDSDDNLKKAPWGETEFANSYTVLDRT